MGNMKKTNNNNIIIMNSNFYDSADDFAVFSPPGLELKFRIGLIKLEDFPGYVRHSGLC